MPRIRLLIADVDGTLVTRSRALTPRTRQAVDRLHAAHIVLSLTTGRPPRGVAKVAEELHLTTPIAAFNGGALVRPDLTPIEERTLPREVARGVVDYLLDVGVDVWVFTSGDWYVRRLDVPHLEREARNVGFRPTVTSEIRDGVLERAVKIVGVSDDAPLLARCEAELRARVGEQASATRSQLHYLDVTHADANKGTVARLNSLFFRIPLDEIAVIGDAANDVLMFGVAGTSIAMGNAGAELKRAARYVTTSNEEEGFANAVDRFVLRQPGTPHTRLGLPSRTRACLFDLDGVLTRTARIHAAAWKRAFDAYLQEWSRKTGEPFVPFDEAADYGRHVDGKIRIDGARAFLASRGLEPPEDEIAEVARQKDELLVELLRREPVETFEGSIRYLRAVREAGLRTAVVSASRHCEEVLASAGIEDLFDARIDGVVAARERLAGKPAPETFLAGARALGVSPADAVVFEDALSGVEAGRAGHFLYVVGVDRLGQASELREHGADAVVSDLSELLEPV